MKEDASTAAALQKVKSFLRDCEIRRSRQAQEKGLPLDESVSEAEVAAHWEHSPIAQKLRQQLDEVARLTELCKNGTEAEKRQAAVEISDLRETVCTELAEQKALLEHFAARLER